MLVPKRVRRKIEKNKVRMQERTGLKEWSGDYTEPFEESGHEEENNMILSRDISVPTDMQKIQWDMNIFAVGGNDSSVFSKALIGPNLMQANGSYIVSDQGGFLYETYGKYLENRGYRVRCLDLAHPDRSNHYNPFRYIRKDKDIELLVRTLLSTTVPPDKQDGDDSLKKAEELFLCALVSYLHHYTDTLYQNFTEMMRLIRIAGTCERRLGQETKLDSLFNDAEGKGLDHFTSTLYRNFKRSAGEKEKEVMMSVATRLQMFDILDIQLLTETDDILLDTVGDIKTALFVITPTDHAAYNCLGAVLYSQFIEWAVDYCSGYFHGNEDKKVAEFSQLVMDGEGNVLRCYQAKNEEQSAVNQKKAMAFLERAKGADIVYKKEFGWYEIATKDNEMVTYRGTEEEARHELDVIKSRGYVIKGGERLGNRSALPIRTVLIFNPLSMFGKIPFSNFHIEHAHRFNLSMVFLHTSIWQLKKIYPQEDRSGSWRDFARHSSTLICFGADDYRGLDTETIEQFCKCVKTDMGSTSLTPDKLKALKGHKCAIVFKQPTKIYIGEIYKRSSHPKWELVQGFGKYAFSKDKDMYLYRNNGVEHT